MYISIAAVILTNAVNLPIDLINQSNGAMCHLDHRILGTRNKAETTVFGRTLIPITGNQLTPRASSYIISALDVSSNNISMEDDRIIRCRP